MKKIIFPITFITMLILSVCAYSYDVRKNLEGSLVRLHILADSDSEYDQNIKLCVRDRVLDAVKDISIENTDKFLNAAENAADSYLCENNIPYRAHAEYGLFEFPAKQYMNITLPAGQYYGVRIILGSGSGHNWWCVMYPPLCVKGADAYATEKTKTELKNRLRSDTYEVITNKNEVKFRILEFVKSIHR